MRNAGIEVNPNALKIQGREIPAPAVDYASGRLVRLFAIITARKALHQPRLTRTRWIV